MTRTRIPRHLTADDALTVLAQTDLLDASVQLTAKDVAIKARAARGEPFYGAEDQRWMTKAINSLVDQGKVDHCGFAYDGPKFGRPPRLFRLKR